MDLKKYKWLYLWIAAAGLILFGLLTYFIKDFGNAVVLYVSASLLIAFVIIRFVPLIKTTRNKWAICINAIELFADFVIGIFIIVSAIKGNPTKYAGVYPFLLGGVLYARGLVYLLETEFFGTRVEPGNFFIHLLLLTLGTVIMARYGSFSVNMFRILFAFAFIITGIICIIDGGNNYNKYRNGYVTKKTTKKVTVKKTVVDKDSNTPVQKDKETTTTYVA